MKNFIFKYFDIIGIIILFIGGIAYLGFDNKDAEILLWIGIVTNGIGILLKKNK